MDYLTHINDIITKLKNANEGELAHQISEVFGNSFTSSELLMSVTHELLGVLKNNPHLGTLIGNDVKKLNDFCRSIGLEVR